MSRILLVEDDVVAADLLARLLKTEGYKVATAPTPEQGMAVLLAGDVQVLFVDLGKLDLSGVQSFIKEARRQFPKLSVLAAVTEADAATAGLKSNPRTVSWLRKPFNIKNLLSTIQDVYEIQDALGEDESSVHLQTRMFYRHADLAVRPGPGAEAVRFAARVAPLELPVFLSGGGSAEARAEVARLIHQQSRRSGGLFVTFICGDFSRGEVEERLFGDGGAIARTAGGSLHLDGVEALPPVCQKLLLERLEGARTKQRDGTAGPVGTRILAGSNRSPAELMSGGFDRALSAPLFNLRCDLEAEEK